MPQSEWWAEHRSRSLAFTAVHAFADPTRHPQHLLRTTWNADRGRSSAGSFYFAATGETAQAKPLRSKWPWPVFTMDESHAAS
jgi:hypothetical protein